MSSANLQNLARIGKLTEEPAGEDELEGLRNSGVTRLRDAQRTELSYASRFDLAYNAAHALALYALRRSGYRSGSRYVVFQALPHTSGLETAQWRVLAKAHEQRNLSEYEGYLDEDAQLLEDMIAAARRLQERLSAEWDDRGGA